MAKRRANGEGNIRKRKDGRGEGRYTAGYDLETGKRVTKNVLGRTQAEAKEKLNHIVPGIGKIRLRKLTTLDIQKFYNRTREGGRIQRYEGMEISGLSNKTIRSLHAILRQCLDQAVKEQLIP